MTNEIVETAKATQEVAKTTGKAIDAADRIGGFFARVMHEPIEAACGMLADTLKYKRWERQLQLIGKAEAQLRKRGLNDATIRPIKPKLALPIFQYASLEDDETLHDIWARLFVTALDPNCETPRNAFVDIIRQLEPVDVKVLTAIYENWIKSKRELFKSLGTAVRTADIYHHPDVIQREFKRFGTEYNRYSPTIFPCPYGFIIKTVGIDEVLYRNSIDVLMRQRLVTSYDKGYYEVCITDLGVAFVEACLSEPEGETP
ncbi:Abi-alpha family protein [Desulfospira joergensenii]|uniref:Abi-alpha family protein n=1 Tax=Desulfospira joergensenii TaxID=53329 RepID=UPI0003B33B62|nr:Abi-alpha family protein [Desulfospira joergensenii]